MKGFTVKEILRIKGITIGSIAQSLDISPQSLSQALMSDNIKTALLEDISRVTTIPLSEFYGSSFGVIQNSYNNESVINDSALLSRAFDEIVEQRKLTQAAQEQSSRLISIIEQSNK